eukprot:11156804-Lingulodinium_polyedra.AAC.1
MALSIHVQGMLKAFSRYVQDIVQDIAHAFARRSKDMCNTCSRHSQGMFKALEACPRHAQDTLTACPGIFKS